MPRPFELPCAFDPIAHAYLDQRGRRHQSVTQILDASGCIDFSGVDPLVLAAAAKRGTIVHALTAAWDQVRLSCPMLEFFKLRNVAEEHRGYVEQYERFLVEQNFYALHEDTERPRLVDIHGTIVGMTPDRVGYFRPSRRLSVVDIKTGIYQLSHPLQLAGYSMGVERVLQLAMQHDRIALYLLPDKYRLQWFQRDNDYHAFLDAMNGGGRYLDQWKQNRIRKTA
jgi:hypothetical protein